MSDGLLEMCRRDVVDSDGQTGHSTVESSLLAFTVPARDSISLSVNDNLILSVFSLDVVEEYFGWIVAVGREIDCSRRYLAGWAGAGRCGSREHYNIQCCFDHFHCTVKFTPLPPAPPDFLQLRLYAPTKI